MSSALMRTLPVRSHLDASIIVQTANNGALSGETRSNRRVNTGASSDQEQQTDHTQEVKKRWRPNRDSLARRRKHGKVGSRRHRRYLNNLYLNDVNYWDGEFEDVMQLQEAMSWCPEYTSVFEELTENDAASEAWEDFKFVDEQKQEKLLVEICGETPQRVPKRYVYEDSNCEEASQKFLNVTRENRDLLKQFYNIGLIQAIEYKLLPLFMPDEADSLNERFGFFDDVTKRGVYFDEWATKKSAQNKNVVLVMKSSRDRKVIHGVCMFYGLISTSKTHSSGQRVVNIDKTKNFSSLPASAMLLSTYLQIILADC
eukprot:TRINITY_DN8819_c0_g1_i1.p1 TRINITY_DN8819_c0_g1~~TRINITY_DN8819_c0_g1_i1.p1  ORF type:complete len:314 (-),score=54.33 TRINITY_DN8819_c0_g1_i1:80-1021(-)